LKTKDIKIVQAQPE